MNWLIIGMCVFGVVFLAFFLYKHELQKLEGPHNLVKKTFLTNNEKHFFNVISAACEGQYHVLAQVSMGALVDISKNSLSDDEYWEKKKLFAMKIVDFVLCDKKTLDPVLIIELDDVSHDLKKDIKRDAYTSTIGLKTVRFWSRSKPTAAELSTIIKNTLKGTK